MEGFEKITCMNEMKLRLSCEASQPLLYYVELHCHIFRISSFYQLEIKKKKPVEMMEMMTGSKTKSKWLFYFGLASSPSHCALFE